MSADFFTRLPETNETTLLASDISALCDEIERLKKINPAFASDEFLLAMLRTIHDGGICVYDLEGRILSAWVPFEMQERMGLDPQAMVGTTLADYWPPQVVRERLAMFREAAETGERKRHEYTVNTPSGEFWIDVIIAPLRDSEGEYKYLVSYMVDVTARKVAERERDENEARYRNIVENSHDLIMLTRPDGIIEYMSPSAEQVIGWPPEELIGTSRWIIHPDDKDRVDEKIQNALAGERNHAYLYRILTRNGETRIVSHSWSPILENGELRMIVSTVRNITEKKQLQHKLEQAERLAAVGQTIADVAHQLKTICLNIRGSASMIDKALAENKTDSLRTLWTVFQRSSDRLADLAIEMLDYSMLDSLSPSKVDLARLIREVKQECQGKANRRKVELRIALDERTPSIMADPAKVSETVMNLITNAIDACYEKSGGLVEISTRWDDAQGEVSIAISDNGPGIPPEIKPRIFDPFFTTKGSKGSGLGLAIVRKAVQLHGGAIEVDSRPGRTTITVKLPEKYRDILLETGPAAIENESAK